MKKFIKKEVIIAFIIGTILTGGIAYAAVSASQINYSTDKNLEIKNVSEALNDLYLKFQTQEDCQYFEFEHKENTQINYDFKFVPSKILAFFSVPNGENIFITYNISKNSLWALGSNGNRNRMECYILLFCG